MHKLRLLKLADLLEADAANPTGVKFDLRVVAQRVDGSRASKDMPLDCGTTACALGLWCLSGQFRGVTKSVWGQDIFPLYKGRSGRDAAEIYFEIDRVTSGWLFINSYYGHQPTKGAAGELAVAKRIRDFVAGKAAP